MITGTQDDSSGEDRIPQPPADIQATVDHSEAAAQPGFDSYEAPTPKISEVAVNDGHVMFLGNQYAQVGELVDMWADLIEGHADKAADFWKAFEESFSCRGINEARLDFENLSSTGLWAPFRRMQVVRRGVVSIPIYVATQGKDLYVSWRAFLQGQVSLIKLVLWVILSFVVVVPFSMMERIYEAYNEYGFFTGYVTRSELDPEKWLPLGILVLVVTGALAAAYGFFRRQGDWQAVWRKSINELHVDDVASLTSAVHKSIVAAADQAGIDTTKLEAREPFYNPRSRKRRI